MRLWHLTRGPWSLGNQPLRDQLKIRIEFKMIFLSVAAPAVIHFEFTVFHDELYHPAPTTLGLDQGCYPFLVGGTSLGPCGRIGQ
jgi:hypothetical protein